MESTLQDNILPSAVGVPQSLRAIYVELPLAWAEGQRAAYYLALEEWIAQQLEPQGTYFFTWQVSPTVVFGRNQRPEAELSLPFCREHGIDLCRRRSGGGCIYADHGNIMLSLVTPAQKVEPLFARYAQTVAAMLGQLGARAAVSGRNDVVLLPQEEVDAKAPKAEGQKVCGNAFYKVTTPSPGRCIVHGTMLFDIEQPELMTGALCPAPEKLAARGVRSVRSRVGTLREALSEVAGAPTTTMAMRAALRAHLCEATLRLTPEQAAEVAQMEQRYHQDDWLWHGGSARRTARVDEATASVADGGRGHTAAQLRFEGVGTLRLEIEITSDKQLAPTIQGAWLTGDFFCLGAHDVASLCQEALTGQPATKAAILAALTSSGMARQVRGMTEAMLRELVSALAL